MNYKETLLKLYERKTFPDFADEKGITRYSHSNLCANLEEAVYFIPTFMLEEYPKNFITTSLPPISLVELNFESGEHWRVNSDNIPTAKRILLLILHCTFEIRVVRWSVLDEMIVLDNAITTYRPNLEDPSTTTLDVLLNSNMKLTDDIRKAIQAVMSDVTTLLTLIYSHYTRFPHGVRYKYQPLII